MRKLLVGVGCVGKTTTGAPGAMTHAEGDFEKYHIVQDRLFESDLDRVVAETKQLEEKTKPETPRTSGERKKP